MQISIKIACQTTCATHCLDFLLIAPGSSYIIAVFKGINIGAVSRKKYVLCLRSPQTQMLH